MAKQKVVVGGSSVTAGQLADLFRQIQDGSINGEYLQSVLNRPASERSGAQPVVAIATSGVLAVDRTKPFNPTNVFGDGWSIWRGAANTNGLTGNEEQDARSLALTAIDFANVRFEHCLRNGEDRITGNEKLARLIASNAIRLDARLGQALFEEEDHKTLEWLYTTRGVKWLDFFGTVLRYPRGYRCVLCFYRGGDGQWRRSANWLDHDWFVGCPSAVLAS